jgi:hypothetical protein
MGTCLFAKPLLSKGSRIFAYLVIIAQHRVYMLQYVECSIIRHSQKSECNFVYLWEWIYLMAQNPLLFRRMNEVKFVINARLQIITDRQKNQRKPQEMTHSPETC